MTTSHPVSPFAFTVDRAQQLASEFHAAKQDTASQVALCLVAAMIRLTAAQAEQEKAQEHSRIDSTQCAAMEAHALKLVEEMLRMSNKIVNDLNPAVERLTLERDTARAEAAEAKRELGLLKLDLEATNSGWRNMKEQIEAVKDIAAKRLEERDAATATLDQMRTWLKERERARLTRDDERSASCFRVALAYLDTLTPKGV